MKGRYYFFSSLAVISFLGLLAVNLGPFTGMVGFPASVSVTILSTAPVCGNEALERGEGCEVNSACAQGQSCLACTCYINGGSGSPPETQKTESGPGDAGDETMGEEPSTEPGAPAAGTLTTESHAVEKGPPPETMEEVFSTLHIERAEGILKTEIGKDILVHKTLSFTFDGNTQEYLEETRVSIVLENDANEARENIVVIEEIPEGLEAVFSSLVSSHPFTRIGTRFLAFQVARLGPGEKTLISYTLPRRLSDQQRADFTRPHVLVEKLTAVNSCKGLVCDDLDPCTLDRCSAGACTFLERDEGTVCGEGRVCRENACREPGITVLEGKRSAGTEKNVLNVALFSVFSLSVSMAYVTRRKLEEAKEGLEQEEEAMVDVLLEEKGRKGERGKR